ncbi:MAG: MFS transporter [Actinomycetota bacterium]|nr:MFS transporter [Actinomycetota bacterium]
MYVLKTYRSLLSTPHARAFVLAGFVARLSISMRALGSVLMVSLLTNSYGLAGAVAAAALLGEAVAAPRLGRLVDRYGQRRVLLVTLAVHSAGTLALVLSAQLSAPAWTLLATAALSGAAALPVGSLVRARWSALLKGSPALEAAFALESTLDELIFVLGPVLVTALALGVAPGAGLLGALLLTTIGSLALALQRRTEPAPAGAWDRSDTPAIRTPGLRVLVATFVAAGAIFGTLDVAMVAFASQVGSPAAAGALLALVAAGSLLAGLVYGTRGWRWPLDKRFLASVVVLWAGTLPLVFAPSVVLLAPAAALAGVAIAPTLIAGFTLVQKLMPSGALTEGLNWTITALGVGAAVGAWTAGLVADSVGGRTAFLVAVVAGGAAVIVAACGRGSLHAR